jgi:hypothetical protein
MTIKSKVRLKTVPLPRPDVQDMVRGLKQMIKRVEAGEFVSYVIGAFQEDARFLSIERGRAMSRLQLVGILECWQHDLINAMPMTTELKQPDE